jgi:RNA polymerase sigma factor (sigma-70 family)
MTPKKTHFQKTYQLEWNAFRIDGNMNALSVIYEANFDLLLNYGHKFCREDSVIEDAIQNIFTNLIRSRGKLTEISNVKQYLMIAQRNELFELISKSRTTVSTENFSDIIFTPEYSVEEKIVAHEGQTRIKNFLKVSLQKLTSHQQEALYLKYDMDLSYEDISKILNISVESCRTAIYRAIKSIRADVESLRERNIHILFSILRTVFK